MKMEQAVQSKTRKRQNGGSAHGFGACAYLLFAAAILAVFVLCVLVGSVGLSFAEVGSALAELFFPSANGPAAGGAAQSTAFSVLIGVRLPRVICVALVGAALSLCGAVMQGLLRNPLADGSTLGVSSGAALGAVLAIAFGGLAPWMATGGAAVMGVLFAFLSVVCIIGLANALDHSLSTGTIILVGVVFSMFANSLISLAVAFAGERLRPVVFWTMGSLATASYKDAALMAVTLAAGGAVLLAKAKELNAFAIGEDNARAVGVDVRRTKLLVLGAVAALIGVAVSIGGSIGFVGLIVPHIVRLLTGPNHKKLLPASLFAGAVFLMLADLAARTVLRPRELPIGVVTSLVGAVVFVFVFFKTRKGR